MLDRDLLPQEIDALLKTQCYAHLGYKNKEGNIGILPISFVYQDGVFYSFSARGSKLEAMRKNPDVCIQVEKLYPPTKWQSVQAWGKFSEVEMKDIGKFTMIVDNFWKHTDASDPIFSAFRDFMDDSTQPMTLYRVTVEKMVGKQGSHSSHPVM